MVPSRVRVSPGTSVPTSATPPVCARRSDRTVARERTILDLRPYVEFVGESGRVASQRNGWVWCALAAVLFGAATPATKLLVDNVGTVSLAGLLYLGAAVRDGPLRAPRPVVETVATSANSSTRRCRRRWGYRPDSAGPGPRPHTGGTSFTVPQSRTRRDDRDRPSLPSRTDRTTCSRGNRAGRARRCDPGRHVRGWRRGRGAARGGRLRVLGCRQCNHGQPRQLQPGADHARQGCHRWVGEPGRRLCTGWCPWLWVRSWLR